MPPWLGVKPLRRSGEQGPWWRSIVAKTEGEFGVGLFPPPQRWRSGPAAKAQELAISARNHAGSVFQEIADKVAQR